MHNVARVPASEIQIRQVCRYGLEYQGCSFLRVIDVWSIYNGCMEYLPRTIRLPITQLLGDDSGLMPCAIPQLCCTIKALLLGLTFSDKKPRTNDHLEIC